MDESETGTKDSFGVLLSRPEGITFEDQESGEKVILLLRSHLITLFPAFMMTLILFLFPFFLTFFLTIFKIDFVSFLTGGQFFYIVVFWYLLVFSFAFYKFLFWYFNVYILTNERIIDVNFKGILDKDVSHARLDRIQDVSPRVVGFFGTFFNFGDVFIQTAGELPEFQFEKVAKPEIVTKEILDEAREKIEVRGGV